MLAAAQYVLLASSLNSLTVLSYSEVAPQLEVTTLGVVGDAAGI